MIVYMGILVTILIMGQVSSAESRKSMVINFVKAHEGCSKEDVVQGLHDDISRVTIFNIIKELKNAGVLDVKRDKPNSRAVRLHVHEQSLLVTVPKDLDEFEAAFFPLLDDMIKFQEAEKARPDRFDRIDDTSDLIATVIMMFFDMAKKYQLSAIFGWPGQLKDKALMELNSLVLTRIGAMQARMTKALKSSKSGDLTVFVAPAVWRELKFTDKALQRHDLFVRYGMGDKEEKVTACLKNIGGRNTRQLIDHFVSTTENNRRM
jgi:hypothetical protein